MSFRFEFLEDDSQQEERKSAPCKKRSICDRNEKREELEIRIVKIEKLDDCMNENDKLKPRIGKKAKVAPNTCRSGGKTEIKIGSNIVLSHVVIGSQEIGNQNADFEIHHWDSSFDVINGIYEGGYKLWEGAIDVIEYMCKMKINGSLNEYAEKAIELGCGHGLPGIACLKFFNALHVTLQDFNEDVIRNVSAKNAELNIEKHRLENISYLSGDWVTMRSYLTSNQELHSFDLVVSSETAYNLDAIPKLIDAIDAVRKCT